MASAAHQAPGAPARRAFRRAVVPPVAAVESAAGALSTAVGPLPLATAVVAVIPVTFDSGRSAQYETPPPLGAVVAGVVLAGDVPAGVLALDEPQAVAPAITAKPRPAPTTNFLTCRRVPRIRILPV